MPAPAGPVPGQLRIVVIRALNLRVDDAGNKPDATVKMRVLRNVKSAEPPPQWESTPVQDTCDPEYDQECVLDVADAAASQLEVTIWNSKDSNPQSGFWGECILNLSKLIPYAGNIIEQDFDVKQGKQFKTAVPASGKLMLQIMFQTQEQIEASQMEETQETQNSSILSAGTSGTGPPPSTSFSMSITVIEARDLPQNAEGDIPETFACVSVIEDPPEMEDRHFHLIDHDLSNGKELSHLMKVAPLHWTKPGPRSNDPVWNDGCTLTESHLGARQLEQLHTEGKLATSQARSSMEGKPMVFLVTVHDRDAYNAGMNHFVGRVVLPEIEAGKPVDQWFMLQTQDGTQIEGPTGRPSGLHLQIVYARANSTSSLGPPNTVPHTLMAPPARPSPPPPAPAPPAAAPTLPLPEAPAGSVVSAASSDAGTRFAFHVEIVEARNLSTMQGLAAKSPFVSLSLVTEPEKMEESHFYLIDHRIGADIDETQLFCLPPSCRSRAAENAGPDPQWKESYTVYAANAPIVRIAQLHAQDYLQTPPEQVELEGQPLLLLATVHDAAADGPLFCGRFLIPQVLSGQPVDQWFKLHDRDGTPVLGEHSRQPASIRLRFAYGAVRPSPPPSAVGAAADAAGAENLPPGWERKMDPSGRLFYVNHTHRTFSWTPPPPAPQGASAQAPSPPPSHTQPPESPPPTVYAQAPSPPPHSLQPPAVPASDAPQGSLGTREAPSVSPSSASHHPQPPSMPSPPPVPPAAVPSGAHASPTPPLHSDGVSPSSATALSPSTGYEPHPKPPPKNAGYAVPGPMHPPKPSLHQAKVFVTVVEGAGLPPTDAHHGSCDAFCEVFLEASGYELAYGRTSACPNTTSPVWNEQLAYGVDADQFDEEQRSIQTQSRKVTTRNHSEEVQVSLVDLKVAVMDWIADGKNTLLGQLRKVPLTELMHNRRMDVWLRTSATDDSGKPLGASHGLDLDKCIVHLVLEYEPPQVDAAVGSVLLDPKQAPKTSMPIDSGASFISAEHSMQMADSGPGAGSGVGPGAPPPAVGGAGVVGGDAGVGMVLKVGDKGQFVVELLAEGSPAALSGKIAPGDILMDVDGQSLTPKSLPEVQALLRGVPHSPVTMTLLHFIPGAHSYGPQQVVVTVLRSKMNFPVPTAPASAMPGPATGIMLLPSGEPMSLPGQSAARGSLSQSLSSMPHQPAMSPPRNQGDRAALSVSQQERSLSQSMYAPAPGQALQRRADVGGMQPEILATGHDSARDPGLARMLVPQVPGPGVKLPSTADPFSHLKAEFGALMADIYTGRSEPDMEQVYAWKNRLLYGVTSTEPHIALGTIGAGSGSSSAGIARRAPAGPVVGSVTALT